MGELAARGAMAIALAFAGGALVPGGQEPVAERALRIEGEVARPGWYEAASLAEAVKCAANLAGRGEAVVLSPGFASFDLFRNYEDRGDQFEQLVRELASATSLR